MKTSHVALLRGINVGKAHRIGMKELAAEFEALGFMAVKTYINSGNVWFEAEPKDEVQRAREIEERLKRRFGFEIPSLLRTLDEMKKAVEENPFGDQEDQDGFYRNVGFIETAPAEEDWKAVEGLVHEREQIARKGREVFSLIQRDPGEDGKFAFTLMEKRLKIRTTVRNWNTTQRLAKGP